MKLTVNQALKDAISAQKAGNIKEADKIYTAILKVQPQNPDANHNMGVLAIGLGKVSASIPFFIAALDANPNISQFWLSYIGALIKLDQFDKAQQVLSLAKLEKKIKLTPDYVGCLNNLGNSLKDAGQLNRAIDLFSQAVDLDPVYFFSLYNIAVAYNESGDAQSAEKFYKQAIAVRDDYPEAYNNLGNIYLKLGDMDAAFKCYYKAVDIEPNYVEVYNNLGNALADYGKLTEALEAFNKALALRPGSATIQSNKANVLKNNGQFEAAREAYEYAITLSPKNTIIHQNLSLLKRYDALDIHKVQMEDLYKGGGLLDDQLCHLCFGLSKAYDDCGDTSGSFRYLSEGNGIRRRLLSYNIDEDVDFFNDLKRSHTDIIKMSLSASLVSDGIRPIFIVGMPRSGTTLVEQIVSAHSSVFGAGELISVNRWGRDLCRGKVMVDNESLMRFRDLYLSDLQKRSQGRAYVIDKMPQNFHYIALICSAFPEAKIIHVERDAAATCWSNYKQYFSAEGLGYSYDLGDVVSYYALYKDLMRFWQEPYGDRMYHLNYDRLTMDQDPETRQLIHYLGLEWEKACLSPQDNKRSVQTASNVQVRDKVYQGSSQKWLKYKPFLNGAFDNLVN